MLLLVRKTFLSVRARLGRSQWRNGGGGGEVLKGCKLFSLESSSCRGDATYIDVYWTSKRFCYDYNVGCQRTRKTRKTTGESESLFCKTRNGPATL